MSQFSSQFHVLLDRVGLNLSRFADKVDVPQSQISRYRAGEYRPDVDMLKRIVLGFDDPADRATILTAYLEDEIPEGLEELVSVQPRKSGSARVREEPPDRRPFLDRMPAPLRDAYDAIGARAVDDPKMARFLIATWNALKPAA